MINSVAKHLGLDQNHIQSVSGGSVNSCFKVNYKGKNCFLKVNHKDEFPHMFKKEENGLRELKKSTLLHVPEIIECSFVDDVQYLLIEWIDRGVNNSENQIQLGIAIADLHSNRFTKFGNCEDNFIGSLVQLNHWCKDWKEFFIVYRAEALIKQLHDQNGVKFLSQKEIEHSLEHMANEFPEEKPTLLHGDLWSGNYFFDINNKPVLIDPAIYFGHREMDIGMTKLFGGFDSLFYEAYNDKFPLEKGWEKRVDINQLYPLLVHAVLFGGNYIQDVKSILMKYN